MHYKILFISIVFLCGLSCRKDSLMDETLSIKLHMNDSLYERDYNPIMGDMGHRYGLQTSMYFANSYGASFPIDDMRSIQFTFGQLTSQDPVVSYEMFKSLFVTGEKKYDSLILAYNQVNSDRVEVDYRDEFGKRWSSTHLVFDNSSRKHTVHQPGSRFVIQEVREMNINGRQGIRFKGFFHCTLYEVNGNRTKQVNVDEFVTQVVKH